MIRNSVRGLLAAALFASLAAPHGWAFGTVSKVRFLGQDAEHEKITRAALSFLGEKTLDELAGKGGDFGAVGAPDDPGRTLLMTDEAHCDNGDYLEPPPGETYRQTREEAKEHLVKCREWMDTHLVAAVHFAAELAKPNETNAALPCGVFVGVRQGNAKCNVIEELGLALHASEDFYSHTNWVDRPAGGPISAGNPPGLRQTGRAPWLDLRTETPFPEGLISGCFTFLPEAAFCNNFGGPTPTKHDDINKDKGQIVDGRPGVGTTKRGRVNDNFALAVTAAIEDTRDKWTYFEEQIRATYGADSDTILCTIRKDDYEACAAAVAESAPNLPSEAEITAAATALGEARKMLADMQAIAMQVDGAAAGLQGLCAAGQGLASQLEKSVAASEGDLGQLETRSGQNAPVDVPAAKAKAIGAANAADAAGKKVARARDVARRQSEATCKLAPRAKAVSVDSRTDIGKLLQDAQFAAQQTAAALKLGQDEFARAAAAENQARLALDGLSPNANSEATALRARLSALLAQASDLGNRAATLADARRAQLGPLVDSARPIFKDAGERIDAGAEGPELEILKQVRQAYVAIADADEGLARCANVMTATATAMGSRLSSLNDRAARLARANAAPVVSPRDMAAIRDAMADARASVDTAEVFLQPIEELNDEAQKCLAEVTDAANKVQTQRNQAASTCTSSYPGSVVNGYKNGAPQCGCPSGWAWNLADNACITKNARRAEEQRACSNLPGSVFDSVDPADKRAVCTCPEGTDWNNQRTACVRVVAGDGGNGGDAANAGQAFGNALANIVTALAQANQRGGQSFAPGTPSSPSGASPASPAAPAADPQDWGVYGIGPVNSSPEIVHGSKAAILKRRSGSFEGLGLSSETVGDLVARGEWKIQEVSRASSYDDAHRQYEALYAKATPSRFWGPFIRINDNLINKYNNPEPIGAPRARGS